MTARLAIIGVGTVGSALLERLDRSGDPIDVVHVCSSRQSLTDSSGLDPRTAVEKLRTSELANDLGAVGAALGPPDGHRVVVDATASPAVAARHAHWLLRGIHVVTASKLANGGRQTDADALTIAARLGSVTYGASATVGAGLPLLRSIDSLRAGGDEITRITGVLSGTLAWLIDAYAAADGQRPLNGLVRIAHGLGLTEPDPVVDLSGADVHRKLLVLARAAGARIEPEDVDVSPLGSDEQFADQAAVAAKGGRRLQYVATWAPGERPTVGPVALPPEHPLAAGTGCDNRVAIWSSRYADQPLVIQGPGAGAGVTAAALLDDIRRPIGVGHWGTDRLWADPVR